MLRSADRAYRYNSVMKQQLGAPINLSAFRQPPIQPGQQTAF